MKAKIIFLLYGLSIPLLTLLPARSMGNMLTPQPFTYTTGASSQMSSEVSSDEEKEKASSKRRVSELIEDHLENLLEEAAQGGGVHLSELAHALQCDGQVAIFQDYAKENFQALFPFEAKPEEFTGSFLALRRESHGLRSCGR